MAYRDLSLWHDTLGEPLRPRPFLAAAERADVAIVGAGYTGLWSAYYLLKARPDLRVTLLEADIAGFGASGRNGGWCSALYPVSPSALVAEVGAEAARAQLRAMREAVTEVARVHSDEQLDADMAVGGTVVLARSRAQLARAAGEVDEAAAVGIDLHLLDAPQARARLNATSVRGGTFTPDCAAVHPAKLARHLAERVVELGGRLYEQSPARSIEPGTVQTDQALVRADVIIRATEAFGARLPGYRRSVAPVYSLMIATEPLPDSVWAEIGLRDRETFSDYRHVIIYGQRTADGRLVFGGRGAPYHFGSRIKPDFDRDPKVFRMLHETVLELFPVLRGHRITHRWGGPLGVARDWHPSVGLDRVTGLAWAGGYVGDGVSTANLAGRTLRDLILGSSTDLAALPWVGHQSPRWEPEPLRWLGVNAGLQAMRLADIQEARGRGPSVVARAVNRAIGR